MVTCQYTYVQFVNLHYNQFLSLLLLHTLYYYLLNFFPFLNLSVEITEVKKISEEIKKKIETEF